MKYKIKFVFFKKSKNYYLNICLLLICLVYSNYSMGDIKELQNKYSGFTLNANKSLSKNDIKELYYSLGTVHPHYELDLLIRLPDSLNNLKKDCKHKNYFEMLNDNEFNYICNFKNNFTFEIKTIDNKISKYRITHDFKAVIGMIALLFAEYDLSEDKRNALYEMIIDIAFTRYNELAPRGVKYNYTKDYLLIVLGNLDEIQ